MFKFLCFIMIGCLGTLFFFISPIIFTSLESSFKELKSFSGTCEVINLPLATEDITVINENDLYTASMDWIDHRSKKKNEGYIFHVDLEDKKINKLKIPFPIKPQGLSHDSKGNLYFINQWKEVSEVVIVKVEKNIVLDIEVISTKRGFGNSIYPISPRNFFITFDHQESHFFEDLLQAKSGKLLKYTDGSWKDVLESINYANGVNSIDNGETLWVSSMLNKELIHITKSGKILSRVNLDFFPDNIKKYNGKLFVAGSGNMVGTFLGTLGLDLSFSSVIYQIGVGELIRGSELKSLTTSYVWKDQFILTSLLDKRLKICSNK